MKEHGEKKYRVNNYRIQHICKIIENINHGRFFSKKYYFNLLKKEIKNFYGYNSEYIKCIFFLFPIKEIVEYIAFIHKRRPLSIRTNLLKTDSVKLKEYLKKRGINVFFLKGLLEKTGIIIENNHSSGACPEYLGGYYTFQGVSSLFSVYSLFPRKNQRILDLTASPGGKTTHIAEIMENSGIIVANDKSSGRIKSLVANLHRMGVKNSIITNIDGLFMPFIMKGFDKVLLDAPCTGSGVTFQNFSLNSFKFKKSLKMNSELQKRLLVAAIDSCDENSKDGGLIVYSTCSIFIEENECVIQYAVENRNVTIVPTDLDYGMPGYKRYKNLKFNENMSLCKRYFSHIHNTDGFFICRLKKN